MRAARGRYKLIEEIGSGASATVWRARDTRSGREVAIKRFHHHLLKDPATRQRVAEEAAAAARVTHPGIVSAVEQIGGKTDLALVFPFVEGTTIAQRLAEGTPLTPRDAASIALQVADALATAHEAGVVHRDVKPANILVSADGTAKLLDFGISRALDDPRANDLTGAGMAIGTLPYMAPEQLAAAPPTPAGDVYGLGAVLYEMLSGRQPYEAASPLALAQEQQLPPARIDGAPAPLVDVSLEAMSADAALRPSAAGLARSLRAWLDGRADATAPTVSVVAPVALAAPPPAASPLPTTARRATPAQALVALGLAAFVVAAAFLLVAPPSDPGTALTPASPSATAPASASAPQAPSVVGASENSPNVPHGGKGKGDNDHGKKKGHH
jgi:eukaryotic-like serine/threonine-protein kinase